MRVLDRKVAPVRVLSVDNVEADDAAFWSNLFQHSLSDFEKYLGLKKVQARHGLGEAQLAKHAGVSKTLLSFLFSYEALPQPVLDFLRDQPHILDANAARAIGIVVKSGGTERVVEAMRELAAGRDIAGRGGGAGAAGEIKRAAIERRKVTFREGEHQADPPRQLGVPPALGVWHFPVRRVQERGASGFGC